MTSYGAHPSRRWIEDPGDPVWFWFVFNGPHGESFAWHRDSPRSGGGLDLLRKIVEEREALQPGFCESARRVAVKALNLPDAVMIRTAIQVLCIVGTDEDLESIRTLLTHELEAIRVDAQCCLFERGIQKPSGAG
jgi:hypothetical protein